MTLFHQPLFHPRLIKENLLLAENCQHLAEQRRDLQLGFRRRIPDLAPGGRCEKLPTKLQQWWKLDFAAFRAEITQSFKQDIPLSERSEWESYLTNQRHQLFQIHAELARTEEELNQTVYALFNLTSDEITLIEQS